MLSSFEQRKLTITQAKSCEKLRHFSMAAIIWRRLGEIREAEECERIIQAIAVNPRIKIIIEIEYYTRTLF